MVLKAILFDLDNTLIDFMKFKRETARAAARAMAAKGLPDTQANIYRKIFETYDRYGIEYQKTFYRVIKPYGLEVGQAERVQQAAIIAYLKRKFSVLRPYPSVKPVLRALGKRFRLGIVTDAPRNKAWQRLFLCGLDDMFEFVVTADDAGKKKPHRAPFELALKKLGVRPSEVLFVGDNPGRDMKGAKRMGMKTCLAEYGVEKKMGKTTSDYRIRKLNDLPCLIEKQKL